MNANKKQYTLYKICMIYVIYYVNSIKKNGQMNKNDVVDSVL